MIGVKVADLAIEEESVRINPVDGIEILANVPELNVLKTLERDFHYYLPATNSLLAPVVAAQITGIILQGKESVGIDAVRKLLTKKKNLKVIDDSYLYPPLIHNTSIENVEEIQIPIITIEYNYSNKNDIENLAGVLQQEFIKNEYSCACISDMIVENSFERNWFPLPLKNIKEWIYFYTNLLHVNIIIVVSDEEQINSIISSRFFDAIISMKKRDFDCPWYPLISTDTNLVSQNLFKWVIKLFQGEDEYER